MHYVSPHSQRPRFSAIAALTTGSPAVVECSKHSRVAQEVGNSAAINPPAVEAVHEEVFFDDFSYQSREEMGKNCWKARTASGPDVDQIIQTFHTISPLKVPMDLDYSEPDNALLRNSMTEY